MRSVQLGDRSVPAAGCGDLSLAIAAARGVDRRDVERALTIALELGLTFVDVHPAEVDAERLAGEVVRTLRLRDRAIVATTLPLGDRLAPRALQAQVEDALRTTKLDALPLVQLPLRAAWLATSMWPEVAGIADRLIREGKVLAWGARLDHDLSVEAAEPILKEPWFVALSVPYSLCARAVEPLVAAALAPVPLGPEYVAPATMPSSSLILSAFSLTDPVPSPSPARKPRRTAPLAILARQPLAGGALAGTLAPGMKLTPRDERNDLDPRTLDRIALEVARLAPLVRNPPPAARATETARGLFERTPRPEHVTCATLAELALRYVIDHGALALPRLHRHTAVPEALVAAASEPLAEPVNAWILDAKS